MAATDQARSMYRVELALDFAEEHLKPNGQFVVKIFQGEGFDGFVRETRNGFAKVAARKPTLPVRAAGKSTCWPLADRPDNIGAVVELGSA